MLRWRSKREGEISYGGDCQVWEGVSCIRGVRTSRGISISDENVRLGVSLVKKNTNKLAL